MAQKAVDTLLAKDVPVIATATSAARQVWFQEMDHQFSDALAVWTEDPGFTYHNAADIGAPIASGGVPIAGMLIIPCSMATVAAIAHGFSDNLLRRAADVTIKERRPLVTVPRETPLSAIHLENMLSLVRLGVVVIPPEPAFYLHPQNIDDIADYIVAKALDALGVPDALPPRFHYEGRKE